MKPAVEFEPPNCPYCGSPLVSVYETSYETYAFDKSTGRYEEKGHGDMDMKCPECSAELYEPFPDGACNYQAEKREKESTKGVVE